MILCTLRRSGGLERALENPRYPPPISLSLIGALFLVPAACDKKDPPTAQPVAAPVSPVATDAPETSENSDDAAAPEPDMSEEEETPSARDDGDGDTD